MKHSDLSFVEFMRNSPLFGLDLDIERDQSPCREIDFCRVDTDAPASCSSNDTD